MSSIRNINVFLVNYRKSLFETYVLMQSHLISKMLYEADDQRFVLNSLNSADFIPMEPDDVGNYNRDDLAGLEKIKTFLCVVCQIIFIFISFGLLVGFYVFYNTNDLQLQPVDDLPKFPLISSKEYLKLTQQYNQIYKKTNFLKGQILDVIRWRNTQTKKIQIEIENALEKYDADKMATIDFALKTNGAYVTSTPNTIPYEINENQIMGFINIKELSNPQVLLQPGILPGQCFAFNGHEGRIRIKLKRKISVTAVTLEHAHRELLDDGGRSAPKRFEVIGLQNEKAELGKVLGSFVYTIDGKALQVFGMPKVAGNESFGDVELHIFSNYGHERYTCVYRFRVHGIPTV